MRCEEIKDNHLTTSEIIYNKLRKDIIMGKYQPGQKIVERKIAEEMNVSRTPVREALSKLALDNLVTSSSYRGYEIISFSRKDIEEFFDVRGLLESYVARLAAVNRRHEDLVYLRYCLEKTAEIIEVSGEDEANLNWNGKFHERITECSGNQKLIQTLKGVSATISLLRLTRLVRKRQTDNEEHQMIYWALEKGDPSLSQTIMKWHIKNVKEDLLANKEFS